MIRAIFITVLCSLMAYSCTTSRKPKRDEPIIVQHSKKAAAVQKPASVPAPEAPSCVAYETAFNGSKSFYIKEISVYISSFQKTCQDSQGRDGFAVDSDIIAMGFPCTGGEGRIDWKGTHYNKPKMVTFLLETNCMMQPVNPSDILKNLESRAKTKLKGRVLAVNPFMVQFWQIPEYGDTDASHHPELRSIKGLDKGWSGLTKSQPIHVELYGRENAWTKSDSVYHASGDIVYSSKNRFTFKLSNVQLMPSDEVAKVKKDCENLRPERECSSF